MLKELTRVAALPSPADIGPHRNPSLAPSALQAGDEADAQQT